MVGVQNLNFSLTNSPKNRKAMRRKLSALCIDLKKNNAHFDAIMNADFLSVFNTTPFNCNDFIKKQRF